MCGATSGTFFLSVLSIVACTFIRSKQGLDPGPLFPRALTRTFDGAFFSRVAVLLQLIWRSPFFSVSAAPLLFCSGEEETACYIEPLVFFFTPREILLSLFDARIPLLTRFLVSLTSPPRLSSIFPPFSFKDFLLSGLAGVIKLFFSPKGTFVIL